MAISKVSFFKTPQAADDFYYWTEDNLQLDTKVYNAATVGQANIFIDPRRAMLSVALGLGR